MDFLDPTSKRSYYIRLFVGFILTAVVIALATTILALITSGFTINRKTGKIVQNGLIFINSRPVAATIYVNHKSVGTTNARLVRSSGDYDISLYAPGYYTWSNNLNLIGGTVEEITYPTLFPLKTRITNIDALSSEPSVFTQTPNRQWLLVSSSTQPNSFDVISQTNINTPITTVTIPSNSLVSNVGANSFTVVGWSTDNKNVLLEDEYNGVTNYIVFNYTNPSASYNVNQTFTQSFTSCELLNGAYNKTLLFDQPSGSLYSGDLSTKQTTQLLSNVLAYSAYGKNQILYASSIANKSGLTPIRLYNFTNDYALKYIQSTSNYILDIASYGGNFYYVLGGGSKYDYIYQNVLNQLSGDSKKLPVPYTLMVNSMQAQNITASQAGRFLSLQSGDNFSVFDIYSGNHYRYQINTTGNQPFAIWMDDNRLESVDSNQLYIWDYDGTNLVKLNKVSNTVNGLFNNNSSAVYYLTTISSGSSWEVTRAGLVASKP
ncbi:MAG TPA: PEGA domain-containing protein [Candidatus Saccharimonadia bacterium]|nr:PEGA domain-containing protein [Candidatus Saccharimonadia bacterium]